LLEKVDPQHQGQTDRRTTAPSRPRIVGSTSPGNSFHGTTASISAKNISRRVRRFLFAYSRSEKLA
jgi:hypothetical protein